MIQRRLVVPKLKTRLKMAGQNPTDKTCASSFIDSRSMFHNPPGHEIRLSFRAVRSFLLYGDVCLFRVRG